MFYLITSALFPVRGYFNFLDGYKNSGNTNAYIAKFQKTSKPSQIIHRAETIKPGSGKSVEVTATDKIRMFLKSNRKELEDVAVIVTPVAKQ